MNRFVLILIVVVSLTALGGGTALWLRPAKAAVRGAGANQPASVEAGRTNTTPLPATGQPVPALRPAARMDTAQIQSQWTRWFSTPARDPFQILLPEAKRAAAPDSPISRFQLLAIWRQTGSRLAVVDRQVCGEGDALAEYRIVSIDPDGLVVQGREKREKITFTSYVPSAPTSTRAGTNAVERWLGPEQEKLY